MMAFSGKTNCCNLIHSRLCWNQCYVRKSLILKGTKLNLQMPICGKQTNSSSSFKRRLVRASVDPQVESLSYKSDQQQPSPAANSDKQVPPPPNDTQKSVATTPTELDQKIGASVLIAETMATSGLLFFAKKDMTMTFFEKVAPWKLLPSLLLAAVVVLRACAVIVNNNIFQDSRKKTFIGTFAPPLIWWLASFIVLNLTLWIGPTRISPDTYSWFYKCTIACAYLWCLSRLKTRAAYLFPKQAEQISSLPSAFFCDKSVTIVAICSTALSLLEANVPEKLVTSGVITAIAKDLITKDVISGTHSSFVINDWIEIPSEKLIARVEEVGVKSTKLVLKVGSYLTVPNTYFEQKAVINHGTQWRRTIAFSIVFEAGNVKKVHDMCSLITKFINEHPLVSKDKKPTCKLTALTKDSMEMEVKFLLLEKAVESEIEQAEYAIQLYSAEIIRLNDGKVGGESKIA